MQNKSTPRYFRSFSLALMLAHAMPTAAVDAQSDAVRTVVGVRVSAIHSDNIGRDALEESGVFGSIGGLIDVNRSGSRLDLSINGALDYYEYSNDLYDSEVLGRVTGNLTASLIPERLQWIVANSFGQTRTNPLRADAPDNRGWVNVLETGPDLLLPINDRTRATVSGRYALRSFEESSRVDSTVTSGQVALTRAVAANRDIGLVAATRSIDFDSRNAANYDVHSGYLTWAQSFARASLNADLGANQLRQQGESDSGLLLRVSSSFEASSRSTFYARAIREFQDAGDSLRGRLPSDDAGAGDLGITTDPLTRTLAGVEYRIGWSRTALQLGVDHSEEDYESENRRDRKALTGSVRLTREISPLTSLAVGLVLRREEFQTEDAEADELRASVALTRRLGQSLNLGLQYQYWDRDSDINRTFTENRVSLTLTYFPWQR